jgi:hypothetical protein
MTTFAAKFRELVMPDLRRAVRLQAFALSRGRCTFTEASGGIWRLARKRGACHLSPSLIAELDDWIDATLLAAVVEIEANPLLAREIVDEALGPPTDRLLRERGVACPETM